MKNGDVFVSLREKGNKRGGKRDKNENNEQTNSGTINRVSLSWKIIIYRSGWREKRRKKRNERSEIENKNEYNEKCIPFFLNTFLTSSQ